MTTPERPWSVPVRLDEIPETSRRLELDAGEGARAAVAKAAGVVAVAPLHATFNRAREGRSSARVVGVVSATVRQTCVVTLEAIANEIEEAVDLVFVAAREPTADAGVAAGSPLTDADEPPEALIDGILDLGAVATEFLILGIDPYARKPGAVFEPPPSGDAGGNPFAALTALKAGRAKRGG